MSLMDMLPAATADGTPMMRLVGNQYVLPAVWDPKEEDRWKFTQTDVKPAMQRMLVRTDHPRTACGLNCGARGCVNHLYVMFELTITIQRVAGSFEPPLSQYSELVCCWGRLPVPSILDGSVQKIECFGGSPIGAGVPIHPKDVLARRAGWRAIPKAFSGTVRSELVFTITPINKLKKHLWRPIGSLPSGSIILPLVDVEVAAMYRQCLADAVLFGSLPQSYVDCDLDAAAWVPDVLVFRRLVDDRDAMFVLREKWTEIMKLHTVTTSPKVAFRNLVLGLWPDLVSQYAVPAPETRRQRLRAFTAVSPAYHLSPTTVDDRHIFHAFHVREGVAGVATRPTNAF